MLRWLLICTVLVFALYTLGYVLSITESYFDIRTKTGATSASPALTESL